jgi:hypothetical protein
MNKSQLDGYKRWFTEYVRTFYTVDDDFLNQNINLKECHTHRVCKEMRDLSFALKMNPADFFLAETIALFHDVGRFEQFKQHRTYKDTISINHCLLGLDVLRKHRLLASLAGDERAIIEKAVEFHGSIKLPSLDERTLHFAKMIRDVDKLDIYELLVKNYRVLAETPEKFKWEVEFPDTPECNPSIVEALMNNDLVDYRQIQTINDAKLLQLGWVFDVYFDQTLIQIYDRCYLQALTNFLPKTKEIKQVTDHVLAYVQNRIQK